MQRRAPEAINLARAEREYYDGAHYGPGRALAALDLPFWMPTDAIGAGNRIGKEQALEAAGKEAEAPR